MPRKKIGTGWFHCTTCPLHTTRINDFTKHLTLIHNVQIRDGQEATTFTEGDLAENSEVFRESTMDEVQDLRDRLNEKAAKWKQQQAEAAKRQQAVGSNVKDRLGPKARDDTSEPDDKSNVMSLTVSDARGSSAAAPGAFSAFLVETGLATVQASVGDIADPLGTVRALPPRRKKQRVGDDPSPTDTRFVVASPKSDAACAAAAPVPDSPPPRITRASARASSQTAAQYRRRVSLESADTADTDRGQRLRDAAPPCSHGERVEMFNTCVPLTRLDDSRARTHPSERVRAGEVKLSGATASARREFSIDLRQESHLDYGQVSPLLPGRSRVATKTPAQHVTIIDRDLVLRSPSILYSDDEEMAPFQEAAQRDADPLSTQSAIETEEQRMERTRQWAEEVRLVEITKAAARAVLAELERAGNRVSTSTSSGPSDTTRISKASSVPTPTKAPLLTRVSERRSSASETRATPIIPTSRGGVTRDPRRPASVRIPRIEADLPVPTGMPRPRALSESIAPVISGASQPPAPLQIDSQPPPWVPPVVVAPRRALLPTPPQGESAGGVSYDQLAAPIHLPDPKLWERNYEARRRALAAEEARRRDEWQEQVARYEYEMGTAALGNLMVSEGPNRSGPSHPTSQGQRPRADRRGGESTNPIEDRVTSDIASIDAPDSHIPTSLRPRDASVKAPAPGRHASVEAPSSPTESLVGYGSGFAIDLPSSSPAATVLALNAAENEERLYQLARDISEGASGETSSRDRPRTPAPVDESVPGTIGAAFGKGKELKSGWPAALLTPPPGFADPTPNPAMRASPKAHVTDAGGLPRGMRRVAKKKSLPSAAASAPPPEEKPVNETGDDSPPSGEQQSTAQASAASDAPSDTDAQTSNTTEERTSETPAAHIPANVSVGVAASGNPNESTGAGSRATNPQRNP